MIQLFITGFKTLFISFLLLSNKPPEAVIEAFDAKFPEASDVKWEKDGDHAFIATFISNDLLQKARFTDKGKWTETSIEMDFEKLPEKVQAGFDKNHPGAKVKSVMKTETSTGRIKYLIEIKKLIKTEELMYSELGKELPNNR